ncbi:hypothetical protein H4R99_000856 [Coemansia sp. RSA 1722]|nr:hypothetical protein LPJ57_000910 [Coemansia sp. RSA 486]KAJ2234716.1 hypothetical protein IWW45_003182 [Coemansia sp. RSA 485]KAJ2598715.1 hypothetical protein GGF39_002538 [Coemansia sp. RSA 1721]KAJ2605762.1 hypothetical protein H4R99_000856 [Coemansia sp. RSA 1722]KAJ2637066.1 hypothetical protein GGF40_002612 [Coemansia sp. RSA 1286]
MNTSGMTISVPLSPINFASSVSGFSPTITTNNNNNTNGANVNPSTTSSSGSLSIALTRSQYAIESGGVLIDPTTNEVCLMFYPDTSEWRLPMGRPDAMNTENQCSNNQSVRDGTYVAAEPSVAGCEPPAHAAQRQISKITGYRCSHLHPVVAAQANKNPCAYMGPQMVEPLALQIEQRVTPPVVSLATGAPTLGAVQKLQQPNVDNSDDAPLAATVATTTDTSDLFSPLSGFHSSQRLTLPQLQADDSDDDSDTEDTGKPSAVAGESPSAAQAATTDAESVYHHRLNPCQYIMTYYYMAWLTQSRFEQRAATQPVGPASEPSQTTATMPSVLTSTRSSPSMPLAEVTWFKMDTAAQVLTHETDKMALREAIHRLARFGNPVAPFAYSSVVLAQDATGHAVDAKHGQTSANGGLARHRHNGSASAHGTSAVVASAAVVAAGNGEPAPAAAAAATSSSSSDAASSSSASSSDDGATKAETAVAVPAAAAAANASRNMDIIRKTATSLGKRGGMLVKAARQGRASTSAVSQQPAAASANGAHGTAESADAQKKAMPRVLSIFYKFMGSSS